MKHFISFFLLVLITSCGRPEINNPEDIISTNAKAVLFIPEIQKVYNLVPPQFQAAVLIFKAAVDDTKPLAFVMTSLEPPEAYFALPVKKGYEEQLKNAVENFYIEESEVWSGYLFAAVRGSIPSSFGNKEFLPENKDALLFAKAQTEQLIKNNEAVLESYKKYKVLPVFRNLFSTELQKIFSYFTVHDFAEFLKQTEALTVALDDKALDIECQLREGTDYAKEWTSMKDFLLPELPGTEADMEFSFSVDANKITFPLRGVETGLKSYFVYKEKPEAVFPMDTVFEKLRESARLKALGAFKVSEDRIGGEVILEAEKGRAFYESFNKFCTAVRPFFISSWKLDDETKISEAKMWDFYLFGHHFDSEASLRASEKQVALYYPGLGKNSISLKDSEEKGLFKAYFKPEKFFTLETGIERVDMKLSVLENEINFKAAFKKKK